MSNYTKFDLSSIKARIKEGTYPSLVGANRAIGKTQGLSEEDRDTLKKYAAKHFGVEAPTAKKATAKKAATKPAKKAAKKSAKKASAKKAAPKAAKAAKKVAKKATGKRASKSTASKAEPAPSDPATTEAAAPAAAPRAPRQSKPKAAPPADAKEAEDRGTSSQANGESKRSTTIRDMGAVITSCDQMLKAISASDVLPKEEAAEAHTAATKLMTRAVAVLDQEVVSPLLSTKAATAAPAKPKKGTKATAPKAVPVAVEEEESDNAPSSEEGDNGVGSAPLSEEEKRLLDIGREVAPRVSSILREGKSAT